MKAVELSNVTKSFGPTNVIKGISLAIEKGEFVSLLGPSGCGKTTLLRMIAGLEETTTGAIFIGGKDSTHLPPERRDIAMVFQSYALLPHLTVQENVQFPLRMRGIGGRAEQRDRAMDALKLVQLDHLANRRPRELSGGQQQRVAVARAVVSSPQVLLLDEPLSNLDARLRESMQEELIQLHRKTGLTTIFVTHDQEEALSLSDRVILLNGGRIEQEGSPGDLYSVPCSRFAASFIGSANLIEAIVERHGRGAHAVLSDGQVVTIPSDAAPGAATMMIRQEDVGLARPSERSQLKATVLNRIFLGSRSRYVVELAGQTLRCLGAVDRDFAIGEDVEVVVDPDQIHLLRQ